MFYHVYKQVFSYRIERGEFIVPILTEKNIQVVVGLGDITIKTGCKGYMHPSVIQFTQNEQSLIDDVSCSVSNEKIRVDEAPVSLVFNNIECLDVVITQLLKLRKAMGGI